MPDSQYIRQAFEKSISFLSEADANALILELRRNGVFLNDPELTLEKLADGVNCIFCHDAANLVIDRVLLELDELYITPTTSE